MIITSNLLVVGQLYTREQLMQVFSISDATIRTGIFRPKNHNSVWVFITEKKTADQTPYADVLVGDLLQWDGQVKGRRDYLVRDHKSLGLEVLVFYRREKYEHPGAAFRYEGPFEYVSHSGAFPVHYVLCRLNTSTPVESALTESATSTVSGADTGGREGNRYWSATALETDSNLKQQVVSAHGARCCVCGFSFEETYGSIGEGFAVVHLRRRVQPDANPNEIDPVKDAVVVCANCHAMIHKFPGEVIPVEELRKVVASRKSR